MLKALLPAGGQVTRASCGHMVSGEKKDFWQDHEDMNVPPSLPRQENEMVGLLLAVSLA